MGWRKELIMADKNKDRVINKLNIRLTQLQDENDVLKQNLQQERVTAAAKMEAAVCQYNLILAEKEGAEKKLVLNEKALYELEEESKIQFSQLQDENDVLKHNLQQERAIVDAKIKTVVCDYNLILAKHNLILSELLSQRDQIDRLEEEVQMQRRIIWGVVSSFFVVAAASLAYAVSRR